MNPAPTPFGVGDILSLALVIGFVGYLIWAFRRRRRTASGCVADGPPGEPYRVFTFDHDLTLPARDVPAALTEDGMDRAKGWAMRDPAIWQGNIEAARHIVAGIPADRTTAIRDAFAGAEPKDWAICLLVDHSGSMKSQPILYAAATSRWVADLFGRLGVNLAILGFSTVGWKGGRARQDWLRGGQPKRPGRLCSLLHIGYQRFGEPLAEEDWSTMLHPDVLRENVDGEAIQWAAGLLRERPEQHKLLIILSDGAPVDDSTLCDNGAQYLWRHIKTVIGDLEQADDIILAGVGINYRVDEFYHRSRSVEDPADMPEALSTLIADIVRQPAAAF
ncbi:cobaltochelatase CobT [Sphingomonas sp. UYAg733]